MLPYMSPETGARRHGGHRPGALGRHALGVMLYELLDAPAPHSVDGSSLLSALATICAGAAASAGP